MIEPMLYGYVIRRVGEKGVDRKESGFPRHKRAAVPAESGGGRVPGCAFVSLPQEREYGGTYSGVNGSENKREWNRAPSPLACKRDGLFVFVR